MVDVRRRNLRPGPGGMVDLCSHGLRTVRDVRPVVDPVHTPLRRLTSDDPYGQGRFWVSSEECNNRHRVVRALVANMCDTVKFEPWLRWGAPSWRIWSLNSCMLSGR